jgi:anion-transporting  ArsA/GET3 family ATPase
VTGGGLSLEGRRVVVVCGSGGVGKTTVSAALALALARSGKRTIALAIDPAKRLATSLRMPTTRGERTTVEVGDGRELTILLLDTKRTFDELVERHAGDQERLDRILSNRFYQRISDTLAGTHEYMAMERLYQLAVDEDWDAIVIDTPPTRSALAFLDAPRRMTDFLGGRMLRWLLWPYRRVGRTGMRGAGLGARALGNTIGRIAGTELLSDVAEFLAAFEGMYDGFKGRARKVLELLGEEQTAFMVVAAPERGSLGEAAHFVERLSGAAMNLSGVVVNRWVTVPSMEVSTKGIDRLVSGSAEERAAAACLRFVGEVGGLSERQESALTAFREGHRDVPVVRVPEMPEEVVDREALAAVAEAVLAPDGGPITP